MKATRLYTLVALLVMVGGVLQAQTYGEFYSFTGWTYPAYGGGRRCLAHFTEHGKKVELPYVYDETSGDMSIGTLIDDATPGVIYNNDWGETNKLYRSTDYGFTWEPIDDVTSASDEYWTFKNAPGVLLKYNRKNEMYTFLKRIVQFVSIGCIGHLRCTQFIYKPFLGRDSILISIL